MSLNSASMKNSRKQIPFLRGGFLVRVYGFYADGFRSMTWGKPLWVIILAKLFFMFFILKIFFFPGFLKGKSEREKQEYVRSELIERAVSPGTDVDR